MPNPSDGWRWAQWGSPSCTRWYLDKFEFGSLAIGLGWPYHFHLHLGDSKRFNSGLIDEQLRTAKYAKLLMPFGVQSKVPTGDSKAVEEHFNYTFGSPNDGGIPLAELAWYAAHETEKFVKQAVAKIEGFTRDMEMTNLLHDLNEAADSHASDRGS